MDFPDAITIIARAFIGSVTDGSVLRMDARIVGRLIRIENGAVGRDVAFDNRASGCLIGVLQHPIANLPRGSTDQPQDGWPIVIVRALAAAIVGAAGRGGR